jgi:hypothetical protein
LPLAAVAVVDLKEMSPVLVAVAQVDLLLELQLFLLETCIRLLPALAVLEQQEPLMGQMAQTHL